MGQAVKLYEGGKQEQVARRVLRLVVAGLPSEEIAETLSVPEGQVKILISSPMFQAMVKVEKQRLRERLADSIPEKLDALSHKAVEAYERGLAEEDAGAYLRAADAILDRGKYPKRTQVDSTHTLTIHIDAEAKKDIETACEIAGFDDIPQAVQEPKSGLKHIDAVLAEEDE